jgi:hypothetical protein
MFSRGNKKGTFSLWEEVFWGSVSFSRLCKEEKQRRWIRKGHFQSIHQPKLPSAVVSTLDHLLPSCLGFTLGLVPSWSSTPARFIHSAFPPRSLVSKRKSS